MRAYFRSPDDNRLRAGWRILLFIIIFWVFSAIVFAIKPLLGDMTKREFVTDYRLLIVAVLAVGASLAVLLARRLLDKRSFVSLGLKVDRSAAHDVMFGFFLSGGMVGLVFLVMLIFGLITFNGFNVGDTQNLNGQPGGFVGFMSVISVGSVSLLLLETVLVGYWEELVFRGYLFQNMIDGMGMKWAIVISCVIYGLMHATNPNAGLLSSTIIVLFGFLRIYGYLATKMLWLSIGMHIGWNFFQGPIFGYAASGHQSATLISQTAAGPAWLSGGDFGLEGSIIVIPIVLLALVVMRWWSRRAHHGGSGKVIPAPGS